MHADYDLQQESRRYLASYVMFNQAVADHLKLHPTDVQCLNLLTAEPGPFTTGRIAELTGLTSGSATRLVDRLEKAGYVVRHRDKADRRRVRVEPVPEAMRDLMELWSELSEGWRAMLADCTEDERALLYRHMRRTVELSRQQIARLRGKEWRLRRTLDSSARQPASVKPPVGQYTVDLLTAQRGLPSE